MLSSISSRYFDTWLSLKVVGHNINRLRFGKQLTTRLKPSNVMFSVLKRYIVSTNRPTGVTLRCPDLSLSCIKSSSHVDPRHISLNIRLPINACHFDQTSRQFFKSRPTIICSNTISSKWIGNCRIWVINYCIERKRKRINEKGSDYQSWLERWHSQQSPCFALEAEQYCTILQFYHPAANKKKKC